ncbi:MAG: DUF58 domain-containing protein [Actinobacteria bacterium]|nr:DUF58 domain-containing protein [Actinomycetota bacterium]MCL6104901.1 DUF58 domain-containing protein [Actinomycetota bacterium]
MSPTPRAVFIAGILALFALILPISPLIIGIAFIGLVGVTLADSIQAKRLSVAAKREVPVTLVRGVEVPLVITLELSSNNSRYTVEVRQPTPPEFSLKPDRAVGGLSSSLTPLERGQYKLGPVYLRRMGPLNLARWDLTVPLDTTVKVFPDLVSARKMALLRRPARFAQSQSWFKGPLGLGTEFESIREWCVDDDIRLVNWLASAKAGKLMSNQYRLDTERNVICLVDTGRLMSAPVEQQTRLDICLDALAAVAVMTEALGDRIGVVAFDNSIRRNLSPRHNGANAVVQSVYDLEPTEVDSDYELAFHTVALKKRSLIVLFCDLVDEATAYSLLDAIPILVKRHTLLIASIIDPDLKQTVKTPPSRMSDIYEAFVALETLDERNKVVSKLRKNGAVVIEADPPTLGVNTVMGYLMLKQKARF